MNETRTSLFVSVLRSSGDCTNGGVTSTNSSVILVPEGAVAPKDATLPVLKVVRRNIGGVDYLHAEPITPCPENHIGYMAGENFVYSSDARYQEWVCQYPISVHDRTEIIIVCRCS